jgi:hypothetical protein
MNQLPREPVVLPHDALDVRLECGKVDAFRVAAREYRGLIVWHARGMPEDGCSTITGSRGRGLSATGGNPTFLQISARAKQSFHKPRAPRCENLGFCHVLVDQIGGVGV